MTNAEKIRSFSDYKLAYFLNELLSSRFYACGDVNGCDFCERSEECNEKTLNWLKSEVEE